MFGLYSESQNIFITVGLIYIYMYVKINTDTLESLSNQLLLCTVLELFYLFLSYYWEIYNLVLKSANQTVSDWCIENSL